MKGQGARILNEIILGFTSTSACVEKFQGRQYGHPCQPCEVAMIWEKMGFVITDELAN